MEQEFQSKTNLDLFSPRSISLNQVINQSEPCLLHSMKEASGKMPNPAFQQETEDIRKIITIILEDEELLKDCQLPAEEKELQFLIDTLPNFLTTASKKAGLSLGEDELDNFVNLFANSDYRLIKFYLQNPTTERLFENLCLYADDYFQHKYALEQVKRAKIVIKRYFPQLFREFPIKVSTLGILGIKEYNSAECEYRSNPENKNSYYILRFLWEPFENEREFDFLETRGIFEGKYLFRKKVHDLVVAIHEYAHGIYDQLISHPSTAPSIEYSTSVDKALNEGFAVLIELLAIDSMIEEKTTLDLDERDIKDLLRWKKQRLNSFLNKKRMVKKVLETPDQLVNKAMSYVEGTLGILHPIYKKAGIEGIKKFLEQIDPDKSCNLSRNSEEYRQALRTKNIDLLTTLVGKENGNS
jgi:hypothetical protein